MAIEINKVCDIARRAGEAILAIYEGSFNVELKGDSSPLTCADRASHEVIMKELLRLFPGIPVLSEEGREIPYAQRKEWLRFWLVDPLDGTKEFIKRNGEFTVNIALVDRDETVLGVVYVPARRTIYFGARGQGAFVQNDGEAPRRIVARKPDNNAGLVVVMSRSHPSPDLDDYLKGIKVAEALPVGSSLKFCVVAEGLADLYPRLGPTMEWDTAAAQAVVEAAGGRVRSLDGTALRYNKENLLNPYFIVEGAALPVKAH